MRTLGSFAAVVALAAVGSLNGRAVGAAEPPASPPAPEASIPFANHGGIYTWQADGERGLWVQDVHRHWYYAKLMAPCIGLQFVTTLRIDTRPAGTFDRFSAIMVPHEGIAGRCQVVSVVASQGPPSRRTRQPSTPAPPAAAH